VARIDTTERFKLGIAGVIIEFTADSNLVLEVPEHHRPFVVGEGWPDLSLTVHYGPLPELKLEEKSLNNEVAFSLYQRGGQYVITMRSHLCGPSPYRMALIGSDFRRGELYIRRLYVPGKPFRTCPVKDGRPGIDPTCILDKALLVILLSRGRGIEFHGCGVILDGEGLLFTGLSGDGKSTMAKLWRQREDATVIGDERIVVRRVDGCFWIYGTPWPSSAGTTSPLGAPLKRVFLIKHSPRNCLTPIKASDAVSSLLVRSFSSYFEHSGVTYTLGLLNEIVERLPCYELGFVPDESVLDFVSKMSHEEYLA
jgi:hypothetical protein